MQREIEELERKRETWEWSLNNARDHIVALTTQIENLKRRSNGEHKHETSR